MLRIGILGCASIAERMMIPAIKKCQYFKLQAVASRNIAKAIEFSNKHDCEYFGDYESLVTCEEIDAIYIPLPPALHYEWAKLAIKHGKHVLVEKPLTGDIGETLELLHLADRTGCVVHENYMFQYHSQISFLKSYIEKISLDDIRLIRMNFCIPERSPNDFRYDKKLGGGALLDTGGYPVCLTRVLLGNTVEVESANLRYSDKYDVDIYGTATMVSDKNLPIQLAFGFDSFYQCNIEIISKDEKLVMDRVFTAPENLVPIVKIYKGSSFEEIYLDSDNHFVKSLLAFKYKLENGMNEKHKQDITRQCTLIKDILLKSNNDEVRL